MAKSISFTIFFQGKELHCGQGQNLRSALIGQGLSPHSESAKLLNCHGLGSCGTCAVSIQGQLSAPTLMERWRLGFPPHKKDSGLRLACQVKPESDLTVTKHPGFWGEKKAQ